MSYQDTERTRRREAQLEEAQEIARLGSWEWDVGTNTVTWSTQLYRIWGLDPASGPATFESYLQRLRPDDREWVAARVRIAVDACSAFEFMHRIQRADGERIILSRGEVICDESGRPLRLVGTAQDVTEQREAEERALQLAREQAARQAAEAANAQLQFLADASAQLASSLDYEQTLRTVAKLAVPVIADWCAVDIVTQPGQARRLAVEHVDRQRVRLAQRLLEDYPGRADAEYGLPLVLRTGKSDMMEDIPDSLLAASAVDEQHLRLLRDLGLRSYVITPLLIDNVVIGAITFVHAESGRRFSRTDLPLLEDLARRSATAIHNARLVTELSEAHVRLAVQAEQLAAQTIELEETMAELEQRNEDLQLASEQAAYARAAAERANEAKSQFLANMSHELRTPLNAISGYSELLELGIPGAINDEQREIVARIQRNQRRLLGLINDILNFTKLSSGRVKVELRPVALAPLIAGLDALVAPQVDKKHVHFGQTPVDRDLVVYGNAERIEQILLNLVTNAVKFTDADGCIGLNCERERDAVLVHVEDSGRGIASTEQQSIFEPFVQIEPEAGRENAGVGLGLSISRELARAMKGDLTVDSEPGRGSRFTLRLPACPGGGRVAA